MTTVSRHLLSSRARAAAARRNFDRRAAGVVPSEKYYASRRGVLRWLVVYDE